MKEKNQNYKDFKNYIHNDCGISNEYVQEKFKRLLKEAIDLKIQQYVNNNERLIRYGETKNKWLELKGVEKY